MTVTSVAPEQALLVTCPKDYCRAEPGKPCRARAGHEMTHPHAPRYGVYRRLAVPVTCRVRVEHVIQCEVIVLQTEAEGDTPFDHEALQAQAVPMVMAGVTVEDAVIDRAARLLGWEVTPAGPDEPWRPMIFGGRMG